MEYLNKDVDPNPTLYPSGRYSWMRVMSGASGNAFGENILDKTAISMFGDIDMQGFKILNVGGNAPSQTTDINAWHKGGDAYGMGAVLLNTTGNLTIGDGSNAVNINASSCGIEITNEFDIKDAVSDLFSVDSARILLLTDEIQLAGSSVKMGAIPNATKPNVLYFDTATSEVSYGANSGSGTDPTAWHATAIPGGDNYGGNVILYNNSGAMRVGYQTQNTIITGDDLTFNALGVNGDISLNCQKLYVNSIRNDTVQSNILYYNTSTKEVTHNAPASFSKVRTPSTMQYIKVPTTTTPLQGEFSRDGSTVYFHKTDNSSQDCSNIFTYINSLINAQIPRIFLMLNNNAGELNILDTTIILNGNVYEVECGSFVFTDGETYNFESVIVRPSSIALIGGNDLTTMNLGSKSGTVSILTNNVPNYEFTDTKLSTNITNYENNVLQPNDIPNKQYVDNLANATLINGGNPSPAQEVTVGVTTHTDETNQVFLNYKCGIRPSVITFMYGSFGGSDSLPSTYRHIFNQIPSETNGYFVNAAANSSDKDGCLIQFSGGDALFPNRKGGYIRFASGGNSVSQTNLTNGDIIFDCGNSGYANSGRRISILGDRRGVLSNVDNGQMGNYHDFCTQPNDFPNNQYIINNFAPINSTVPKLSVYFESNGVSSGGASSSKDYIQGVLTTNSNVNFTVSGSNKITYTGSATKTFLINYSFTILADSLDRNVIVTFVKNDTANSNPPEPQINGSRSQYCAQSQINYALTISKSFTVSLATNETVRAYVSNTLNANTVTISDFNIDIKEF